MTKLWKKIIDKHFIDDIEIFQGDKDKEFFDNRIKNKYLPKNHFADYKTLVFKETDEAVKGLNSIKISKTIYIPKGYSSRLYYKKEGEVIFVHKCTFGLLKTLNKCIIASFIWKLNFHALPAACRVVNNEIHVDCISYQKRESKPGICYEKLLKKKKDFIQELENKGIVKNVSEVIIERKKLDCTILGSAYVIVYGDGHPWNHVQKGNIIGANLCTNANEFRVYAKSGLYSEQVFETYEKLKTNTPLIELLFALNIKFTREDFYNGPHRRDIDFDYETQKFRRSDVVLSDLIKKYVIFIDEADNIRLMNQTKYAIFFLVTYAMSLPACFTLMHRKIDLSYIHNLQLPIKLTKTYRYHELNPNKRIRPKKRAILPEIIITKHFTDIEQKFTNTTFVFNYNFRIRLINKLEEFKYVERMKDFIYRCWFKTLIHSGYKSVYKSCIIKRKKRRLYVRAKILMIKLCRKALRGVYLLFCFSTTADVYIIPFIYYI